MSGDDGAGPGLARLYGPLEIAVMEEIWRQSCADVRQVSDALVRNGSDVAYSTIKTVMERLTVKGELTRDRQGRQYVYTPTRDRSEAESAAAQDLVDDLFSNYRDLAVSHFVAGAERDPAQLDRLRRMLEEIEPDAENSHRKVADGRDEQGDHAGSGSVAGDRYRADHDARAAQGRASVDSKTGTRKGRSR